MQIMKHQKFLLFIIAIVLLSCLVVAVSYNQLPLQASESDTVPQVPQLQVFSPQQNGTYQIVNVPLNISANNATARITYSLDGADNATLYGNVTATPSLTKGVHNLTVYALDNEGKVGDFKNVTFNVDIPYPPNTNLTPQQLQETITYFKSRGFSLEVYTDDNSSWRTISVWLNMGVVHLENKEALATFAIEHNISELKVYIDSTYVSFNAYVYNNSPLPIIYTFSTTMVLTPQQTVEPTPLIPTATIIPKPSVLTVTSPTNSTYSTNTVELTYTINSKVVWSYYGLNIGGNGAGSSDYTGINELYTLHGLVPFKGNITLNLPEGTHRLLLAVQTEESRGSSVPIAYQTIDFIINTPNVP